MWIKCYKQQTHLSQLSNESSHKIVKLSMYAAFLQTWNEIHNPFGKCQYITQSAGFKKRRRMTFPIISYFVALSIEEVQKNLKVCTLQWVFLFRSAQIEGLLLNFRFPSGLWVSLLIIIARSTISMCHIGCSWSISKYDDARIRNPL